MTRRRDVLSGFGGDQANGDVVGNLGSIGFAEACDRSVSLIRTFHKEKLKYFDEHDAVDGDYFPCWYCFNYFGKLDWLRAFPENPWYENVWPANNKERRQ